MPRSLLCSCLVLVTSLLGSTNAAADSTVRVAEGWVRAMPPVAGMTAAFMDLTNASEQDRRLVGAEAPGFARVELHRSVLEDGMARMIPQEAIQLPAGETVSLAPGGLHLMLIDPAEPLRPGGTVPIRLEFADGQSQPVELPVQRAPAGTGHGGHSHHHH